MATTQAIEHSHAEETRIGVRLRHARVLRGKKIKEIAATVGCSEGFISKIENNKVRPSIAMLHKLAKALDINMASLFEEPISEQGSVHLFQAGRRPILHVETEASAAGIRLERLLPQIRGMLLQANILHIEPGARSDGSISHDGEELGFVLEGRVDLIVDEVSYTVEEGDCFFFSSSLSHGYVNIGTRAARILWVNTPPTF